MISLKIPLFFHRQAIYLIDDNETYMENLIADLSGQYICKSFSSPDKARNYLLRMIKPIIPENLYDPIEYDFDLLSHSIDIKKIKSIALDEKRFSYPGLMLADYDMPRINGVTFCQSCPKEIKSILLTGVADESTVISAFNNGSISAYIAKGNSSAQMGILDELINKIEHLQIMSFIEACPSIVGDNKEKLSALFDESVSQKFFSFFKEKEGVEFYVIDPIGSLAIIDRYGGVSVFGIQSESNIKELLDFSTTADAVSDFVVSNLKSKNKIPLFLSEKDYSYAPSDWDSLFYEAEKIEGFQDNYYITMIHEYDLKKLDIKKLKSLNDILE